MKLNEELMKLSGTDYCVTSAYHPQSNGLCERLNQTLQNILLKRVNENQDDWDVLLPAALFAIRTSKQKSTQYSPFQLMFGRCSLYHPFILVIYCTCDTTGNQSFPWNWSLNVLVRRIWKSMARKRFLERCLR